jgi:membrane-bound lytic murein transglycosylase A
MIFFQDLTKNIQSDDGPIGSLGIPLTAGRSIAIDTSYVSLGLPVFLSTKIPKTVGQLEETVSNGKRLVFAQDTGKAIKGPNRGDLFFGSGAAAGDQAGRMKYSGTMTILIPN